MRIVVCADDGDQIAINVDALATEQRIMRLEFHNFLFDEFDGDCDIDEVTLTIERARELAFAILSIADMVRDDANNRQSLLQGDTVQMTYSNKKSTANYDQISASNDDFSEICGFLTNPSLI
jgi:hypothetical protein